ncbi:cytochrome c biogenesis protein CcsA, partial [Pseudomonas sp. BJa3]|uniref:cytochrome c biogenesis protein CcsA n=1 Tax=Pseudomonas sp. BJa3 TaxID=2986525 RepID=UPI002265978D
GRMAALGVVAFPLAALLLAAYHVYGHQASIGLDWRLQLHAWLALLAYAALAIAALLAVMLWAQERALRRREFHLWLRALPPLTELEDLLFRTITVGFILLTATLLTGVLFVENFLAQKLS